MCYIYRTLYYVVIVFSVLSKYVYGLQVVGQLFLPPHFYTTLLDRTFSEQSKKKNK